MHFSTSILAIAATLPFTNAYFKGFNLAANNPDGSCKSQADWQKDFDTIKSFPGGFASARVYASSDCGTLANAVPAALNSGIKLLAGVWTEDNAHYEAEKQALLDASNNFGVAWIAAISVGSEDLYRGDTDANTLAQQIYDVRGMMSTVNGGSGIPIGHVDTWNAWTNGANAAVIQATDFIGFDAYPYFQNAAAGQDAVTTFQQSLDATRNQVNSIKAQPIWITETGWPVAGPSSGAAVPSVDNAQEYWSQVMCPIAFPGYDTFVYTLQDYNAAPAGPSFGVVDASFNPLYNLAC